MKTLLWVALALAALVVLARVVMPKLGASVAGGVVQRDGRDALLDCPGSPNCQGSMSSDAGRRVAPLPGTDSVAESLEAVESALRELPGSSIVSRDGAYVHATVRTRVMGYIDDVEFLADPDAGVVHVRSASRLGKSDLGANARRIERLRSLMEDALG